MNDLLEIAVSVDLGSVEAELGFVADPTDPVVARHLDSHHHFGEIDPRGGYWLGDEGDSHHGAGWGYSYHLDDWDIDRHEYSLPFDHSVGEIDLAADFGWIDLDYSED